MSKLERLLNLTAVLLDTERPLSADVIRTRVEGYPETLAGFRRSFERDKEDLRSLGIPLKVERVPGVEPPLDGYRIPPDDYYLPDPALEPDELAALHLASMAVQVDGLGEQEALWKLGGLSDARVEAASGLVAVPTHPALVPLFEAITSRTPVGFDYNGEQRRVDPWRLDFHRGRWYLTGFDHVRDAERNFRLDRITTAVELVGEPATASRSGAPASGRRAQAWEIGDDAPTLVKLRVDTARVAWARRQFGPDVPVSEEPDGGAVFEVPVVMKSAFRSLVLEFLDHAEILEPEEMRNEMVDWLQAIAGGGAP